MWERNSLCPEDAQRLTGAKGDQATIYHGKLGHGRFISLGELGREVGFGDREFQTKGIRVFKA